MRKGTPDKIYIEKKLGLVDLDFFCVFCSVFGGHCCVLLCNGCVYACDVNVSCKCTWQRLPVVFVGRILTESSKMMLHYIKYIIRIVAILCKCHAYLPVYM